MSDKINELSEEIRAYQAANDEELEQFRLKFIGRKNVIADLFAEMRNVPNDQKKAFGQNVNALKNVAQEKFQDLIDGLKTSSSDEKADFDMTLPPVTDEFGSIHPLTATRQRFIQIFERIGFNVSDGPEN